VSALSYFTWHDVHPTKRMNVKHVILTKFNILPEFDEHLDKFDRLNVLLIDSPFAFSVKPKKGRPKKSDEQNFIRYLQTKYEFCHRVFPYVCAPRSYEVRMTVHVDYGRNVEEVRFVRRHNSEY
jgi:hypothetical protein